jgi:hypothetical protein
MPDDFAGLREVIGEWWKVEEEILQSLEAPSG